jgi:hypothetical protein
MQNRTLGPPLAAIVSLCLCRCLRQNALDEQILARLQAAQGGQAAVGGAAVDAADRQTVTIEGGTEVLSSITASVWEVLVKVRQEPNAVDRDTRLALSGFAIGHVRLV